MKLYTRIKTQGRILVHKVLSLLNIYNRKADRMNGETINPISDL